MHLMTLVWTLVCLVKSNEAIAGSNRGNNDAELTNKGREDIEKIPVPLEPSKKYTGRWDTQSKLESQKYLDEFGKMISSVTEEINFPQNKPEEAKKENDEPGWNYKSPSNSVPSGIYSQQDLNEMSNKIMTPSSNEARVSSERPGRIKREKIEIMSLPTGSEEIESNVASEEDKKEMERFLSWPREVWDSPRNRPEKARKENDDAEFKNEAYENMPVPDWEVQSNLASQTPSEEEKKKMERFLSWGREI